MICTLSIKCFSTLLILKQLWGSASCPRTLQHVTGGAGNQTTDPMDYSKHISATVRHVSCDLSSLFLRVKHVTRCNSVIQ